MLRSFFFTSSASVKIKIFIFMMMMMLMVMVMNDVSDGEFRVVPADRIPGIFYIRFSGWPDIWINC